MLSYAVAANKPLRAEELGRLTPSFGKENAPEVLNLAEKSSSTLEAVDCTLLHKLLQIERSDAGGSRATSQVNASAMDQSRSLHSSAKKACLVKPRTLPKRRAVTFPLENTQVHLIDSNDAEVSSDLFYTRQDIYEMKRSAKRLCCEEVTDTSALIEAYDSQGEYNASNEKDEAMIESVRISYVAVFLGLPLSPSLTIFCSLCRPLDFKRCQTFAESEDWSVGLHHTTIFLVA